MLNLEPVIIWEKWVDPYGSDPDAVEWPGYDQSTIIEDNEEYIEQPTYKKNNVLATTMGIIPFNEHTDCTKIFNFWIGHTNFDITKTVAELLQSISGVETLDIFTRYRFRISFGKAFEDRKVMDTINHKIKEILL
jgi:hypothetical protein